LETIRKQANLSTGLLRVLSQVSGDRAKSFYPVDLNRAVQEILAEQAVLASHIQWVPAVQPVPSFRGIYSAVKQVIRLLLTAASGNPSSALRVRVCGEGDGVQMTVESEENLEQAIDPAFLWGRLSDLEQLAGQSLLRQLDGDLGVSQRPGGGFVMRVAWSTLELLTKESGIVANRSRVGDGQR
jgi:hypothetical protein